MLTVSCSMTLRRSVCAVSRSSFCSRQEAVPLLHTLKFVHRIQIDVAERPHFHAQLLYAAARFTEVFNRSAISAAGVGVNS